MVPRVKTSRTQETQKPASYYDEVSFESVLTSFSGRILFKAESKGFPTTVYKKRKGQLARSKGQRGVQLRAGGGRQRPNFKNRLVPSGRRRER